MTTVAEKTGFHSEKASRNPYPASWANRLIDWVSRLPVPWWLFYILLALVVIGAVAVALWLGGVYQTTGFHPMQVWVPFLPAFFLFFMDGINRVARSAMRRFRPAFKGSDAEFAEATYRLTKIPARPTFFLSVVIAPIMLPLGYAEFSVVEAGGLTDVLAIFIGVFLLLYSTSFAWMYHVIHQLREIHRVHLDYAEGRLENIRPMYALSRVTSFTAIGIILFEYGWFPAQPGLDPFNWVTIGETAFGIALALAVYIVPLWGAHLKLGDAKETALIDVALRKRATRGQLHLAVEGGKLEQVSPLNTALGALQAEEGELVKLATWPWSPGSLRNTLGAVLLPMVLWMLQYGMQKLFQ